MIATCDSSVTTNPSRPKPLKPLPIEPVHPGSVGPYPEVTTVVLVDGLNPDLLGICIDGIPGEGFPIVAPDAFVVGRHPEVALLVGDGGGEIEGVFYDLGFQIAQAWFLLVVDLTVATLRRDVVTMAGITNPELPVVIFHDGADAKGTTSSHIGQTVFVQPVKGLAIVADSTQVGGAKPEAATPVLINGVHIVWGILGIGVLITG